jgi:two-component system, NarL family, sensor kinase
MAGEGHRKFQLIDGFRSSHAGIEDSDLNDPSALARRANESLSHSQIAPGSDALHVTLKAMEERISSLLEDRRRTSRDLHDCILQSLYAIGLNIETSLRATARQAESEPVSTLAVKQINRLIQEVRGMIQGLETGAVQKFDLESELMALRATYEQVGRLQIGLDLQPKAIEVLTHEEEREIVNIVREALSNCVRHAKAGKVAISIRRKGGRIQVRIIDDGAGFDLTDDRPRGYGLANMEVRTRKLGGSLHVQSKIGRGTCILAEFSLEPLLASL